MTEGERLIRKKAVYRTEMDTLMSREQSDALWAKAAKRLDEILIQYSDVPRGVRMHTDKVFSAAAVYLTVKEAVGQETAYRIIEDTAVRICSGAEKKLAKLMNIPGMRSLFVAIWDPMTKKIFGKDCGFQNVFYPKKKGEYRMDVTDCPYCRYFTALGCPELTKIFCDNDERIYGNLPGLEFKRAGTLGKGADRCDFYIRKE